MYLDEEKRGMGAGGRSLRGIVLGFLSGVTSDLSNHANEIVRRQEKRIMKMLVSLSIMITGAIFLSGGLAVLLNEVLGFGDWAGFLIIGFFLLLLGLTVLKSARENND